MIKKNLTRKDLCTHISKSLGFSKNFSLKVIDDCFDMLSFFLIKNKKVKITSFGTFEVIDKKERIGRNPKTKVEAKISARKIVKFKPSEIMKKKLNSNEI